MSSKHEENQKRDEVEVLEDLVDRIAAHAVELRLRRGWTQSETAKHCSMSMRMYQRVERAEGSITLISIARLCKGFEVDVMRLVRPVKK